MSGQPGGPVTVHVPGLVLTEHEVGVPLDHGRPDGEQITVFAREVAAPDGRDRPFLVFLQGGPGSEAPRPTGAPSSPGWLDRALRDFRVLMLDQRGTGRSAPIGILPGRTPQEQADHLALFRADAIVADAERVRAHLGVDRWSVLGQSFGGFCALRYLSAAPHALREALFTGGLPPVGHPVDDVYRATWETSLERNRRFYARYPGDLDRLRRLQERADAGDLVLSHGDTVTSRRLRSVGNELGMSDGAEKLHYLLERDPASPAFLHDLADALPFRGSAPLYTVLQEACYADGEATRWAAERTMPEEFRDDPTLLFAEHVSSWTCEDDAELAPLAEATGLLAARVWPALYDAEVLRACDVPCAAAIYADDPYVDRVFSEETARMIPTMRPWITNELQHNGLRADGARVVDRLLGLARGYLA